MTRFGCFAKWGLIIHLGLCLGAKARAAPIAVDAELRKKSIAGADLEYWEDKENRARLDDVLTQANFQPTHGEVPSFGYSHSTYWFRFTLKNTSAAAFHSMLDVQYPVLDRVTFFVLDAGRLLRSSETGDMLPFSHREVKHRNPVLPLLLEPGNERQIYIRLQTESSMQMPLVLWNERDFWEDSLTSFAIQALYFGIMGALALYNLFIYLSYRARSYIIYVGFVVTYALFQMSLQGIGMQVFWPESPQWNEISVPLFIALSVAFANAFPIPFLKLREHARRLSYVLAAFALISALLVIPSLIHPSSQVVRAGLALAFGSALLCISAGIMAWRGGNPLGKFFMIAWTIFLVGTLLATLNKFGIIERNWITESAQQFGSCAETLLLSFALAYQMNLISREKLTAQKEALAAQEAMNQMQKETNEQLESKVMVRTLALQQKTLNLNMMLQHMNQGVLMIMENCVVHEEHSICLLQILEEPIVAGRDAIRLLFHNTDLSGDSVSLIRSIVSMAIYSSPDTWSVNVDHLPREYRKGDKILEIDWNAIIHDDVVERIMVTLRDVTEMRAIKQQAAEQEKELYIVGRIIDAKPQRFRDFIDRSLGLLPEGIDADGPMILRHLHTIKGNARVYALDEVADLVHAAEDMFMADSSFSVFERSVALSRVRQELQYCRTIYEQKLRGLGSDYDTKILRSIKQRLEHLVKESHISGKTLHTLLASMDSCDLEEALDAVLQTAPGLAKSLGKPVPRIRMITHDLRLHSAWRTTLQDVFVHLLRNAIDHGLETAEQRLSANKIPEGTIQIEMNRFPQELRVTVRDDGRGLNLIRLEQKFPDARARTWEEIANVIFRPGVSTAETISAISGRGAGLDAVRMFLQERGGDISLQLLSKQDKASVPFVFHIHLPLDALCSDEVTLAS